MAFGMLGVARTGSVYLTMSVTLERYFAIVRPLAVFRIKKFLAPAAITFALVYNSPRFFEFKRQPMPEVFQPHSSDFQFVDVIGGQAIISITSSLHLLILAPPNALISYLVLSDQIRSDIQ